MKKAVQYLTRLIGVLTLLVMLMLTMANNAEPYGWGKRYHFHLTSR